MCLHRGNVLSECVIEADDDDLRIWNCKGVNYYSKVAQKNLYLSRKIQVY